MSSDSTHRACSSLDARRSRIRTVQGDITVSQLGPTLMHEHLAHRLSAFQPTPANPLRDEKVTVENASRIRSHPFSCRDNLDLAAQDMVLDDVKQARTAGCASIVENTLVEFGRDPEALLQISHDVLA